MRHRLSLILFAVGTAASAASTTPPPENPFIDMGRFLAAAQDAARHRELRRVTEDEFLRMRAQPGTVVLDARSRAMYDRLHVAGAVNLSFPDFTAESLARAIPDRTVRVLIYCNNNFAGAPDAFQLKAPAASLNFSTYVALYTYGYRNVYELAPYADVSRTAIPLVSTRGATAR